MTRHLASPTILVLLLASAVHAQEKPVVGLIPKAQKPIKMDGKLDDWDGAFVTPVHVGHPDFANRGGQFLYLWDDDNLYIGLRCLDQKPAHVGGDGQLWNGDAVEFYLDTRRGDKLGAPLSALARCTCSGRRSPRPTSSPGWRSVPCPPSRTSSCKEPRSPPRRRRGAGPPSSSCPGRTSPTSRRRPAKSSASTANCAAATAGHGWIAPSFTRRRLRSVRRRPSGG